MEIRLCQRGNGGFYTLVCHGIEALCHEMRERRNKTSGLLQGGARGESISLSILDVILKECGSRQELNENENEEQCPAVEPYLGKTGGQAEIGSLDCWGHGDDQLWPGFRACSNRTLDKQWKERQGAMVTIERVKRRDGETEGWLRIQRRLPHNKGIAHHVTPHPQWK